jgi:hypothetical protein
MAAMPDQPSPAASKPPAGEAADKPKVLRPGYF